MAIKWLDERSAACLYRHRGSIRDALSAAQLVLRSRQSMFKFAEKRGHPRAEASGLGDLPVAAGRGWTMMILTVCSEMSQLSKSAGFACGSTKHAENQIPQINRLCASSSSTSCRLDIAPFLFAQQKRHLRVIITYMHAAVQQAMHAVQVSHPQLSVSLFGDSADSRALLDGNRRCLFMFRF